MTPPARVEAAIGLLTEIMAVPGAAADQIVAAWFRRRRYAGAKDRRWITDTVWNTLRRRGELEWAAGAEPRALVLAALALHEGLGPEAIAARFAADPNGPTPLTDAERELLPRLVPTPAGAPAWARDNFPAALEGALHESLGPGFADEAAAMAERAPLDLRVNLLKASRDQARAALSRESIVAVDTPWSPVGLRLGERANVVGSQAFAAGMVEVQDEGSQLAALLLGARPGETVIDYCAGGGGKALAVAAAMGNRGRVIATDTKPERLRAAAERVRRAGAAIIDLRGDPAALTELADRVLVDAPCTGSGTWRRNPAAKWTTTPDLIAQFAAAQAPILDRAAALVRPGGRLAYVTCSLFAAENGGQIAKFLARNPAFREVPARAAWEETLPGPAPAAGAALQLTPLRHGTDGFFVAVLERVG